MKRAIALFATLSIGALLFYASRFWFLDLWGRPGLFGWSELPPGGGLLGRWLRGTLASPFELLIWAIGAFLILGGVEALIARAKGPRD
ncbi:MAG: hypothetical protein AAF729_02215 [Pseudomonadota bacterium]